MRHIFTGTITAGTLTAAALLGAAPLAAQGEFGVKGGLSFGNISNSGVLPNSLGTRTGFAAGVYLGYRAKVIGFGIEGLYAQRGLRSDQAFANADTRLDYIDIPAYVKVTLPIGGVDPFVYAGPQVSFEIRCRNSIGAACLNDTGRRTTDYAGVIGAGIKFGRSIGIEGRYVYGLRDLNLSTVTDQTSYRTRSFLILVSLGS